jgi:hypothetical protein
MDGATTEQVGLTPIDPACTSGGGPIVSPPYVPLAPPDVPASCSNGFEIGDATPYTAVVYTLDAIPPQGAAAITLDVDFATYHEPDGVVITGTLADQETRGERDRYPESARAVGVGNTAPGNTLAR